jgi:LPXTG-motif cell wall-anchored protein
MLLGYKFAKNRDRLMHQIVPHIKDGMLIGLVALLVVLGGYVLWRRRQARIAKQRAIVAEASSVSTELNAGAHGG